MNWKGCLFDDIDEAIQIPSTRTAQRLTSADIEDGKVEYDEKTKGTITYKKIDGGYEMHYVIPQPNGTNKTQMKTFYDPTPVPMNEDGSVNVITSADIEDGKVEYDPETNAKITYKKIKNGYQMHYLIPQPNGTNKTQVKTFYDPRPTDQGFDYEDDDDNMDLIDNTQKKTSISKLNQEQLLQQRKQQEQQQRSGQTTTINTQEQQQQQRSTQQSLEETKRTSSISSSTTTKDSRTTQILIEKQKKIVPVPPDHSQPPSKKLSCVTNNVPGGTELIYTTILTDGRIQTIIKTIYEKVEITTIEESEIVRIDSNGKPIIPADKKIVPSENPDDITYVETIQISGGVQYRYTTITKDLLVSRTTETFYEPAPVEDTENVIPTNRNVVETETDTSNVRGSHPSSRTKPNDTERRLTSDDIVDGTVIYDEITKTTTTYKKIEKGYQIHTVIPQPDGTNRTETKTFFDPEPVPNKKPTDTGKGPGSKPGDDRTTKIITSHDIEDGKVVHDEVTKTTKTYRKIERGYQVYTTRRQTDGTEKKETHVFYDPEPIPAPSDDTKPKQPLTRRTEEDVEETPRTTPHGTPSQKPGQLAKPGDSTTPKRLTSDDIEDGKVIYDEVTKTTTTYKKIEKGYQIHTVIPQPDGTNKTETKTFFDPEPVPNKKPTDTDRSPQGKAPGSKPGDDKTTKIITSHDIEDGKVVHDEVTKTTKTYKKIERGYQVYTTRRQTDGTEKKETHVFYDPEPIPAPDDETKPKKPQTRITEENVEDTPRAPLHGTPSQKPGPLAKPGDSTTPKRLTSDDIEDGKVIYDEVTKTTTTYKKIEKGYQIHTVIPQPDGTNKTETKTFFDPEPVPNKKPTNTDRTPQGKAPGSKPGDDKTTKIITSHDIEDGKVVHDEVTKTTKTYKKIERGYQVYTTRRQTDGTEKKETHVFYDPEPIPAPDDETKPKKPQTRITEENVEDTPRAPLHGTPSQKPSPLVKPADGVTPKRLTSHDIEDGKVVYDEVTKTTTTYKKIENGYQVRTVTRQPDGTDKTATQVFYDPEPIPAPGDETKPKKPQTRITEEDVQDTPRAGPHGTPSQKPGPLVKPGDSTTPRRLTSDDIEDGKVIYDEVTKTTTTYKKIEKGYQIHTVQRQPDGTDKTETKTFFDPEPIDVPGGKGEKTKTIEEATTRKQTITTTTTQEEIDELVSTPYPQKIPSTQPGRALRRLTSVDIEDGKVIYDQVTKTTTTFKKIENGYKMDIVKPQPDGTNKTETKIFYDPVPDPLPSPTDTKKKPQIPQQTTAIVKKTDTEDNEKKIISCQQVDDYTTIVTRRIPNGREEITTTIRPNGSKTIQIRTFYDTETVEITDTTYTEETSPGQKKITTTTTTTKTGQQQKPISRQSIENQQQMIENQQSLVQNQQSLVQNQQSRKQNQQSTVQHHQTSLKKMDSQEKRTELRSQQTFEEVRRVTKKTQMTGESSLKLSQDHSFEESILSDRKTTKFPVPISPEDISKPGGKTTVVANKVPGGTEYIYTTILADGSIQTTIKTVYEKTEVHIYQEETQYQTESKSNTIKQQQQKQIKSCDTSSRQVIKSDNAGDVTTVETKKIPGGIQYHYKTITSDGVLKRTMETFYDPVPIED